MKALSQSLLAPEAQATLTARSHQQTRWQRMGRLSINNPQSWWVSTPSAGLFRKRMCHLLNGETEWASGRSV
ncbi:hypothetical protein AOLI_G00128210 [Acnodon oligacanthus]